MHHYVMPMVENIKLSICVICGHLQPIKFQVTFLPRSGIRSETVRIHLPLPFDGCGEGLRSIKGPITISKSTFDYLTVLSMPQVSFEF
jgi:hypothetical protein